MAVYATQQDMVDRYGEAELRDFSDRTGLGQIDAAVVAQALASAEAQINGYVGTRYDLPLPEVPPLLVDLACSIARFRLQKDRSSDRVRQDYEDAVGSLKDLSTGKVDLPISTGEAPPAADGGGVQVEGPDRVFSRETLRDF